MQLLAKRLSGAGGRDKAMSSSVSGRSSVCSAERNQLTFLGGREGRRGHRIVQLLLLVPGLA